MHEDTLRDVLREAVRLTDWQKGGTRDFCFRFIRSWIIFTGSQCNNKMYGSIYFLFWKNLNVTNVQIVELVALLRSNVELSGATDEDIQVNFTSSDDYIRFINNVSESILLDKDDLVSYMSEKSDEFIDTLLGFHGEFFSRTVILDPYYTSALAHIPRSLLIDIRRVTTLSGYVHSSGPSLYFRNIEKAKRDDISAAVALFLSMNEASIFITPYAYEYFDPFETSTVASTRNGLDGVRIQLSKHYVERNSLVTYLNDLEQEFEGRLIIPEGMGSYKEERAKSLLKGASKNVTLWFLTDSGMEPGAVGRAAIKDKTIYLILYAQLFYNSSQMIVFKERKPAWIASTTLPHTLSAAMLNIAKEKCGEARGSFTILDPFCGTGTILLDAAVRFPNAQLIGLDRNPLAPSLVRSNLELFAAPLADVQGVAADFEIASKLVTKWLEQSESEIRAEVARLMAAEETPKDATREHGRARFLRAFRWLLLECRSPGTQSPMDSIADSEVIGRATIGFSAERINLLADEAIPLGTRFMFYALWRSVLMHTFSIRHQKRSWKAVFRLFVNELERCNGEFDELARILLRSDGVIREDGDQIVLYPGSYSNEGAVEPAFFRRVLSNHFLALSKLTDNTKISELGGRFTIATVRDAVEVLEDSAPFADLIITDPPYGFNDGLADSIEMQSLFMRLAPALVHALRPGGQLVMALPAFAKNGKRLPYYQSSGALVRQIIGCAQAQKRSLIRHAETLPGQKSLFTPPWYAGTASTVERRIVHFLFR